MDEQSISIGEYLRQERLRRRLSLQAISQELHIRRDYLEALEGDHWDKLPGEVYGQGFLKSYARFMDLDSEALVNYRKRLQGQLQDLDVVRNAPPERTVVSRRRSKHTASRAQRRQASARVPRESPVGSAKVVLGVAGVLVLLFVIGLVLLPPGSQNAKTAGGKAAKKPAQSVTKSQSHHIHQKKQPVKRPVSVAPVVTLSATNSVQGTALYQDRKSPVTVLLNFTGLCWVEVWRDGTTQNPYGTTYNAGQQLTVSAPSSVAIKVGTRSVTMTVNGQALSLPDPNIHVLTLTFQHG